MPGIYYSGEPKHFTQTKPSKWQPRHFLDPFGLFHKPKTPKYKPSELELETQQMLKDILGGKSPMFSGQDVERRYQTFKEGMLPEYQRLGKEMKKSFARKGIRGGPEVAFEQRSAEDQLQKLMDARRRISDEVQRLEQMRKQEALGQLTGMGRTRSAAEYQSEMERFQQQLQQQQEMANMLASIGMMGAGAPSAPAMGYYQQQYGGQQYGQPIGSTVPYSYAGMGRV